MTQMSWFLLRVLTQTILLPSGEKRGYSSKNVL
jgi:hypothetical protein